MALHLSTAIVPSVFVQDAVTVSLRIYLDIVFAPFSTFRFYLAFRVWRASTGSTGRLRDCQHRPCLCFAITFLTRLSKVAKG